VTSLVEAAQRAATWDLRLGDCLDPVTGLASLPDKSINHVICDPPYEAEAHAKVVRCNTKGPGHGKSAIAEVQHGFAAITENQRAEVSRQLVRVCRGWILAFCQLEALYLWRASLVAADAKWRRSGIWAKPDAMPQITGDRPGQGCEGIAIAWAGEGRSRWNGRGKKGLWIVPKYEKGRINPTQKPIRLMRQLLEQFTQPGDLILAPYAGGATTLVAAEELGRRSLGWEMDPASWSSAQARLAAAKGCGGSDNPYRREMT
jgi:site-specific DNA-methyltransferase (adenine-specific)